MEKTVWVDAWQLQCCGTPFTVGSQVRWTLAEPDTALLTRILGPDVEVDAAEDHHGRLPDDTPETAAKVSGITAVYYRRGEDQGPLSSRRREVRTADGRMPIREGLTFVGYLVRLREREARDAGSWPPGGPLRRPPVSSPDAQT